MLRSVKKHPAIVPCECQGGCQRARPLPATIRILAQLRLSFANVLGNGPPMGRFCCPLCLRILPETCATMAHAPSERLGGQVAGVQCKGCNSYLGRRYEAELAAAARRAEGLQVVRVQPNRSVSRFVMRAELGTSAETGSHTISLEPAGSGRAVERATERMRALGGLDQPFQLHLEPINEGAAAGALVAWAYLLWFSHLGYSFVLSRSLRRVRKAILTNSVDDLRRAPVGWRTKVPRRWERGVPVLVNIDEGKAFGIGWEWAAATAILPPAFDPGGSVYDAIDDAVEEHPEHLNLGISYYPILERIRFGLPIDGSRPPPGSPVLREGPVVLAGAGRKQAEAELAHPIPPQDRTATRYPPITIPEIPQMPSRLKSSTWRGVAANEARRVAVDPEAISSEVVAAITAIQSTDGAEREVAWHRLESLVDPGVAAHLRDLWLYSLVGAEYDPETDRGSPEKVMRAVRGVPKPHRPEVRNLTAEDLRGAPGLYQQWLVWVRDGAVELVGPFFTGRALLAAVRVRTRLLRAAAHAETEAPKPLPG